MALLLGLGGASWIIVRVFAFIWAPDLWAVGAMVAAMLGIGVAGSWPILSARPARALRSI